MFPNNPGHYRPVNMRGKTQVSASDFKDSKKKKRVKPGNKVYKGNQQKRTARLHTGRNQYSNNTTYVKKYVGKRDGFGPKKNGISFPVYVPTSWKGACVLPQNSVPTPIHPPGNPSVLIPPGRWLPLVSIT